MPKREQIALLRHRDLGNRRASYSNLEYDLASGERGKRDVHTSRLLALLTGTEAAIVERFVGTQILQASFWPHVIASGQAACNPDYAAAKKETSGLPALNGRDSWEGPWGPDKLLRRKYHGGFKDSIPEHRAVRT